MEPKISIIIPTHNRKEELKRAICSVLVQTWPNWECIVSEDSTIAEHRTANRDLCSKLALEGYEISYLDKPHSGQADTVNQGVQAARGELVVNLNDDDALTPNSLAVAAEHWLKRKPRDGFMYGDYLYTTDWRDLRYWRSEPFDRARLRVTDYVTCAAYIRRDLWSEVGGLRDVFGHNEDWDMALRLAAKCDGIYIPEALYIVRVGEGKQTDGLMEKSMAEMKRRIAAGEY